MMIDDFKKNISEYLNRDAILLAIKRIDENIKKGFYDKCILDLGYLRIADPVVFKTEYKKYFNNLEGLFFVAYQRAELDVCRNIIQLMIDSGATDISFHIGLANIMEKNHERAIECLESVERGSQFYKRSRHEIAKILTENIDSRLNKFLDENQSDFTSLEDMNYKLKYLIRLKSGDASNNYESLRNVSFREIDDYDIENNYHNQELLTCTLSICQIVFICNEMINKYSRYYLDFKNINDETAKVDLSNAISVYNHLIAILQKCVDINLPNNNDIRSIISFSLDEYDWNTKIKVFRDNNRINGFVQSIINAINSKHFSRIDNSFAITELLQMCNAIDNRYAVSVLDHYYKEFVALIQQNNERVTETVLTTYCILKNRGKNKTLVNKIDKLFKQKKIASNELCDAIEINCWLSRPSQKLLHSAESMYSFFSEHLSSTSDASSIATAYFRIIEIELNNKIIEPLARMINTDILDDFFKEYLDSISVEEKNKYREKWSLVIKQLKKISTDNSKTMELGNIRYLIKGIEDYHREKETDKVGEYLYQNLKTLLTPQGDKSLLDGSFQEIVSKERIDKYRNPVSHTEVIPLSIATESKNITNNSIRSLMDWIKKETR